MSLRRKTVSWSWCLAAVVTFSCSVFPDEATLPSAVAGVGGSSVLPQAGVAAEGGDPAPLGGAGAASGGALSSAGAGVGAGTGAFAGAPPLGLAGSDAGGAGGATPCENPQQTVAEVIADTWIEAAKPTAGHGSDNVLSVVGGGQERRVLLEVTLPAATGATLRRAVLVLRLQANADVTLARRQLRLYQLEQPVLEGRATWNRFNNGSKGDWRTAGGDFGAAVGQSPIPAGTTAGKLTFNVTELVRSTLATSRVPLSLILLEISAPPPAPAELAFTSREGDASNVPKLILEFCEP